MLNEQICKICGIEYNIMLTSGIPSGYCSHICYNKHIMDFKLKQKQEKDRIKKNEKFNEQIANGIYFIERDYTKAKEKFNLAKDQYLAALREITKAKETYYHELDLIKKKKVTNH